MNKLVTLIEARIAEAKADAMTARGKGDFDAENWNSDLKSELQRLLDRAPDADCICLDKDDAERIADFLSDHQEAFVEALYKNRVSLPRRHVGNLNNTLRGRVS